MEPPSEITGSKAGITAVVMLCALMAMIDITIVNVALTDIRASFGTPIDQIGWVSTGYMMANIVVIPLTGWLQRRFGYRRTFAFSVALFTLASALCGLAWSLPSLVLFRVLQGLGGGAIIPTAQTVLFARYPSREHGLASGLYGLAAITGPLLGPTIGGELIAISGWHWIFLVNVPFGIAAVALIWRFIDQPGFAPPKNEPIDRFGIGLLAVGMPSLQYVLEEGNREGWFESVEITVLTAVAAVTLVTFVVHELEAPHPVVDLRIFSVRSYAAGTGLNFLTGFALFSGSYLFSLFCGAVMKYSALDTGKVFLVAGTVSVVLMPLIGRVSGRLDPRGLLLVGLGVVAFSQFTASRLTASAGFWDLVEPNMIRSAGLGFVFIPVSVAALSAVPADKRGNATGLFNLTRELGGSIGTALMGTLITDGIKRNGSYLSEHVSRLDPITVEQAAQLGRALAPEAGDQDLAAALVLKGRVVTQAMIRSFSSSFELVALAISAGVLLLLLLEKPRGSVDTSAAH